MNIKEFVTNTVQRALGKFHEDHPSGDVLVAEYNVTTAEELLAYLGKASFAPIVVKRGSDYYTAILANQRNSESALVRVLGSSDGDYYLFNYTVTGNTWASSSYGLQKKLVSGTDIKTINGESLLGSGDISSYVAPVDTGWQKNNDLPAQQQLYYRRTGDVVWVKCNMNVLLEGYSISQGIPDGFKPDDNVYIQPVIDTSDHTVNGQAYISPEGNITLYTVNNTGVTWLYFYGCYPVPHLTNAEIAALVSA